MGRRSAEACRLGRRSLVSNAFEKDGVIYQVVVTAFFEGYPTCVVDFGRAGTTALQRGTVLGKITVGRSPGTLKSHELARFHFVDKTEGVACRRKTTMSSEAPTADKS